MLEEGRDAIGRRLTPANTKGYRKGFRPPHSGRKLPVEVLSLREIDALLAARTILPSSEARDLAMIWLLYRHDLKIRQVVRLRRSDWNPVTGRLTVAASPKIRGRTVRIDPRGRELLEAWIEVRRTLPNIRLTTTPMFCQIYAPATGRDVSPGSWRDGLRARAKRAGIEKRVSTEGLRWSGRAHALQRTFQVGERIAEYIDDDRLRQHYPDAYDRWQTALDSYNSNPVENASRIGHDCREALMAFAAKLAADRSVAEKVPMASTVKKVRAVLDDAITDPDVRLTTLRYWGTVSDLVQRQEHSGIREHEQLDAEDARRVVFHTILAMHEVDIASGAASSPLRPDSPEEKLQLF